MTVASQARAVAASPCSNVQSGRALPADAFTGYLAVTLQPGGLVLSNKIISIIAGVSLDTAAAGSYGSCPGLAGQGPAITSFALVANDDDETMTLTNNQSYAVTGGAGVPGTGTSGSPQGGCSGPDGVRSDACNTYIGIALQDSNGTASANPKAAEEDGTNWAGVGVSLS